MIVGPDWICVENPKTGSNSMRRTLLAEGGEVVHHKHLTMMAAHNLPPKRHVFVVVRNPWDRMVSGWAYATKQEEPFETWLTGGVWDVGAGLDFKRVPQTVWADQCSRWLRFEDLEGEWERYSKHLGFTTPLRHMNASTRPTDYREAYNLRTKNIVMDRFWPDIEQWGYEF